MYRDGDDDPEFMEEQAAAYWEREMVNLACLMTELTDLWSRD